MKFLKPWLRPLDHIQSHQKHCIYVLNCLTVFVETQCNEEMCYTKIENLRIWQYFEQPTPFDRFLSTKVSTKFFVFFQKYD